jgi:hypothetical protein
MLGQEGKIPPGSGSHPTFNLSFQTLLPANDSTQYHVQAGAMLLLPFSCAQHHLYGLSWEGLIADSS